MSDDRVGQRLSESPHPEMVRLVYEPRIQEELRENFSFMTRVNQAHVIMLKEQKIITGETLAALLEALDQIAALGPGGLPVDPAREDLYYNYERAVISLSGAHIGGQMHTGRSRNDLGSTLMRMRAREVLLDLLETLLDLRQTLVLRGEEEAETVMPGYTHLQPAQPITLGHYLLALEEALARDSHRLMQAYPRTNSCPLGAGALAGTGHPIDRDLTRKLLGFDSLVENTLDAVASRDYLLEILAAGAIMGTNLSRFSQDLYVWYTAEFALVDLRDQISGTSSIMPQKKNPVVLESLRGKTAHVVGALSSALSGVRNTSYSNVIDAGREVLTQAWPALEELKASLILARLAVENLVVDPGHLLARCSKDFSTVTDLADALVGHWHISFRQAHEVVGAVVRESLARGITPLEMDSQLLAEAALEVLGKEHHLPQEVLRKALDPMEGVRSRSHVGGPAPSRTREAVRKRKDVLSRDMEGQNQRRSSLSQGEEKLQGRVQEGLSG